VLFPPEELSKRFTAEQAEKLQWKVRAMVLLLGAGWPVEVIARELNVSHHTVSALAARESEKVAGSAKEFERCLRSLAARWFGSRVRGSPMRRFSNSRPAGWRSIKLCSWSKLEWVRERKKNV
jgi:hypothetical protein